ncbi:MAG: redox-sensing transcriptional repressor Rex [Kiritimatiellia bacterium]
MNLGTPVLQRLPLYLRTLRSWAAKGATSVSGVELARTLGLDPIVVRKDLARTGVRGTPRVGFSIERLIPELERLTGADAEMTAVLVGVGKLGSALLGYPGFRRQGLSIAAGFDAMPERCNIILAGVPVFPVNTLTETVLRMGATLGILTVPADRAQRVAEQLVAGGVKAIWNFTPVQLDVPETVLVQREDLAVSLAVLLHRMRERNAE